MRTMLAALVVALLLAFGSSKSQAQSGCGYCWWAANGPNYMHVFAYSTPEPPDGYHIVDEEWRFLEASSGELPSWAGHTWWLPGKCDEHANCIPEDFQALVEQGDNQGLVA